MQALKNTCIRLAQPATQLLRSLEMMPAERQQTLMYWVGGLSPLATNVVTPIVTHYRFKKSDLPESERRFNVSQEIARQTVSGALQVLSFFGGAWIFGQMGGQKSRTLVEFLGGVFCAFVSYALIRPLVSSEIILRWLYRSDALPNRHHSGGNIGNPGAGHPIIRSQQEQRFADFLDKASRHH